VLKLTAARPETETPAIGLLQDFASLPDPRQEHKIDHLLIDIVTIAILESSAAQMIIPVSRNSGRTMKPGSKPIVMLTARGQELDKVVGLEVGADDYLTKPFGLRELLARVRAHLRRESRHAETNTTENETYSFGAITLDFSKYRAAKHNQPLNLSPREFELLKYFIQHRGTAVTRDQLLNDVWGYTADVFTRTVDNHIAKLRQKIEDDPENPQYLITVHRVGYRFLG
jgi:DNA-binding response OmpR family regulator